ncbi:hypothetical protein [Undibacterium danionis]|uniref:Uncharacterized protein n=1 Tax=Undibacterium danionis TaxID=1812100 RepID=A0ABV6IEQ4_9BURK
MNLSKFYLKHVLAMFLIVNFTFFSFDALSISNDDQQNIPQSVEVAKKKNPGDLPYAFFYKSQGRLLEYMPVEPRTIDFSNRISFNGLGKQERDDYFPSNWGVAIVSDSVDVVVPMTRGGYFVLPDLPQARQENAKLLFNTTSQKGSLKTAWILRYRDNTLSYTDFARSFDEVKQIQEKIKWYELKFKDEKKSSFDSLKACFLEAGGDILLDDVPAKTSKLGRCVRLEFAPELVKSNPRLKFVGALEIVTLANTKE